MGALTTRLLAQGAQACCVHVRADAAVPLRLYRSLRFAEVGARLEGVIE
jgi:predicted GNAT family acetyltransferase